MECGRKGMGKEEAGEMEREGGGHSCLLLPFFHCSFRMGAALAASISFHFSSNRAALAAPCLFFLSRMGTACAVPNSFRSERGQHFLPPFLFISFRMGGQRESHMLPPFLSVSIGGSVYPTAAPIPFGFEWGQCVSHTPPPVSFSFNRGQCEPHTPPPFCVLYPPIMGGILFFYFN